MTWIEGIDAAWNRPTPAQLVAAGKQFIVGYVSHDPAKNLSAADCAAYLDAGVAVGLVWETMANRALDGGPAGSTDGAEARRQARALGFPDEKPICFAVDFEPTTMQLGGPVRSYGLSFRHEAGKCGVYGGLATVKFFADYELADVFWQTYAWSHGQWDTRAQVRQYRNGYQLAGHDTDLDRATDLSPFWTKENMMTAPTAADVEHAVWHTAGSSGTPGVSAGTDLATAASEARSANDKLDALAAAVAALPDAIAKAVVAALPPVGGVTVGSDVEVTGTLHLGGGAP